MQGQINVEVRVMRGKSPILFTWWNKEDLCVNACLVTCQCQGFRLDQCQQIIPKGQAETIPSSTIHALGDMKWAEKFAKALEASELITIPEKELDVKNDEEEPTATVDGPPKEIKTNKKNKRREVVKRGLKDLEVGKMIFDKSKAHVNSEAHVILEELMLHENHGNKEKSSQSDTDLLPSTLQSEQVAQNPIDTSLKEERLKQRTLTEAFVSHHSDPFHKELESSCIEESARICGLKEPDERPRVMKINNIEETHNHSPLSPRTFVELQPMRSDSDLMHPSNEPMKDIHAIQLANSKLEENLGMSGEVVDQGLQSLAHRNISESCIPEENTVGAGPVSQENNLACRNETNMAIAGMTFSTLESSASLFRSEMFATEQHQTTICANPVDVSVSGHMSFINNPDISLSEVHQGTMPLTYPPHGQLSFDDQSILDTIRGIIDGAPKSNLNTNIESGMNEEQHPSSEDALRIFTSPQDKSKKISAAMASYLAHKDDEYKRKYKKYQNDPNSVFVLCERCGAALTNKSIKRHMESIHSNGDRVRAHQCQTCGKKFLYETNLKRHSYIHTGVRFKCSICDKTYKQDWNRQVHEKTHLNPGSTSSTVRKPLRRNIHVTNKSVECKICGKTLKQQSMKLHMDSHNQKMSTCQICGKTVKSGSKYQHAKLHTNNKSHACSYCSAKFYFKSALVAHMRKHTKERPIPCRYCDRTFPRYEARTNHERLHTGERPYRCDMCQKDWRDRPTYMQHMQKHHPGV